MMEGGTRQGEEREAERRDRAEARELLLSTRVSGDPSSILGELWATVQTMPLAGFAESPHMFTCTLNLICAPWET